MKLSYNWIKEYVDLKGISAEALAERLTMSGSEVDSVTSRDGDKIMELEITTNRPDCLNMIGLAREASVIFDRKLKLPPIPVIPEFREAKYRGSKTSKIASAALRPRNDGIECVIKATDLCQFYSATVIKNVKVKSSSDKILGKISAIEKRSINNVVDITNFCLFETGQPLHAFDMDKLKGGKIIIRRAKKGEKIITIDEVERTLDETMLVIADAERAVAIAGVMGGKDTEVTRETKNILLESAYFSPSSVRSTSRRLALFSDSSYRFERGVDKGMVVASAIRAGSLIINEAGGEFVGSYPSGKLKVSDTKINFNVDKAAKLIGTPLDKKKVKNILIKLGMKVSVGNSSIYKVEAPSFREDIKKEVDIIEEVARVEGYSNVPLTIPLMSPSAARKEKSLLVREKILDLLVASGYSEIKTYSLIGRDSALMLGSKPGDLVELANPISEEHKVLAPTLLDGMMRAISWNMNRKNNNLMLFEIAKIYKNKNNSGSYAEHDALCIGITGPVRESWNDAKREADFYDIKGSIERILCVLGVKYSFSKSEIEGLVNAANIELEGVSAPDNFIGKISDSTLKRYDLEKDCFVLQVILDNVYEKAELNNIYKQIPKFPDAVRDLSILCDETITAERIEKLIEKEGGDILRSVNLLEIYKGANIPQGKKSFTYSLKYGLNARTLRDEEIASRQENIKRALGDQLNVIFR